jgi:hypothetical protein
MEIIGFGRLIGRLFGIIAHRLIESANRQFQQSAHPYFFSLKKSASGNTNVVTVDIYIY